MSTYTGINDYVSQVQPEKKDLQFYGNVLQTKQSSYNANHAQLSGLYGSLLNADLTRDDSNKSRDDFFQLVGSEIQKISGMDLSLESNKIEAGNVFSAIYDDKNMVKDMVWTGKFKNELSRAEAFKNCIDPEKCGGSYWEQGEKYMYYKAQEFKNAGIDEVQSFEDVSFVPYTNVMDKAIKYAKDAGISITKDQLVGNYMVTTKNGPLAVGPLTSLFSQVFENNPQILKQFEVDAYVNRKDGMNSIMAKTGISESQALGEYLKTQGQALNESIQARLNNASADEEYISGRLKVIEGLSAKGKVPQGSSLEEEYMTLKGLLPSAQQATQYFTLSKNALDNASNTKYIKNIGAALDQANASLLLDNEINKIANTLAYRDSEQTMKADEFAKMRVDYQYDSMLENAKHKHNMELEEYKNQLKQLYPEFGGDSTKHPLNKTLNASIDDAYNKFAGTKEIKGDPKVEQALALAKEEVKKLKTDYTESKTDEDKKLYEDAENKVRRLETKNNEILRRKKVEFLDKNGMVAVNGQTWGTLYGQDRVLNKRTGTDYDKGLADESKSSSIYELFNLPSPTSNFPVKSAKEASAKQDDNEYVTYFNKDLVTEETFTHIIKNASLNKEQRKWYAERIEKVKTEGINSLSNSEKELIAKRANTLKPSVFLNATPSNINEKNIDTDHVIFVATHSKDPNVRKLYTELSKKTSYSDEEKKNIVKRYNKLHSQVADVTDEFVISNEGAEHHYSKLFNDVTHEKFINTRSINQSYIDATKGTPEYAKLKDFAIDYIKKNGNAARGFNNKSKLYYSGLGFNIKRDNSRKGVFGETYQLPNENNISDWAIDHLIKTDKNFSNTLYDYHIKQRLEKPSSSLRSVSKNETIRKQMDDIYYQSEYENALINLKKDKRNNISLSTQRRFGASVDNFITQKGQLITEKEFINRFHWEDPSDLKEKYQQLKTSYNGAIEETLTQSVTKNGTMQMGVGAYAVPIIKIKDVSLNADSKASNYVNDYIHQFELLSKENKELIVISPNGKITKASSLKGLDPESFDDEAVDFMSNTINTLKKKNPTLNIKYAATGAGEDDLEYSLGVKFVGDTRFGAVAAIPKINSKNISKKNWDQLELTSATGYKFIFQSKPTPEEETAFHRDYSYPKEEQIFKATGKLMVYRPDDDFTTTGITMKNTANGIVLQGRITLENGEDIDISRLTQEASINSVAQAKKIIYDCIDALN